VASALVLSAKMYISLCVEEIAGLCGGRGVDVAAERPKLRSVQSDRSAQQVREFEQRRTARKKSSVPSLRAPVADAEGGAENLAPFLFTFAGEKGARVEIRK